MRGRLRCPCEQAWRARERGQPTADTSLKGARLSVQEKSCISMKKIAHRSARSQQHAKTHKFVEKILQMVKIGLKHYMCSTVNTQLFQLPYTSQRGPQAPQCAIHVTWMHEDRNCGANTARCTGPESIGGRNSSCEHNRRQRSHRGECMACAYEPQRDRRRCIVQARTVTLPGAKGMERLATRQSFTARIDVVLP